MSKVIYRNITLKEMFEDLVKWQLGEDCKYNGYFYYQDGDGNFDEITQVDLLDNWEVEKNNIYVKESAE